MRSNDYINEQALNSSKIYLELSYNILETLEVQSTNALKEIMKMEFAQKSKDIKFIKSLTLDDIKNYRNDFFTTANI